MGSSTWGTVTTLKEEPSVVKRFVAHHLSIGAHRIFLYFDDPKDPAAEFVSHIEKVTVIKCGNDHWRGRRPKEHQRRQKQNANAAYRSADVDWLIHIDADELIYNTCAVSEALDSIPASQNVVHLQVAECFAGTFNGRNVFRYPLPNTVQAKKVGEMVYGEVYPILDGGLLGHTAGKFFVRTGVQDMRLSIHGPFQNGARNLGHETEKISLLHFHASDEDEWVKSVERRLSHGAYQRKFNDDRRKSGRTAEGMGRNEYLTSVIRTQGDLGLRAFHKKVCRFDKTKRPLRRFGSLLKVNIWTENKVEHYFPGSFNVATKSIGFDNKMSRISAEINFRGSKMIIYPDDNYTEYQLARGREVEGHELSHIQSLVSGRDVIFFDIGANAGIYSLLVACCSSKHSRILSFEPNPTMMDRLRQNTEINCYQNINLYQLALANEDGEASLQTHSNLGQARLVGEKMPKVGPRNTIQVPIRKLKSFVRQRKAGELSILKIDIEGAEPSCLVPFFECTDESFWPDFVLYEHTHTDIWSCPPRLVFPENAYKIEKKFKNNTLLRRTDVLS